MEGARICDSEFLILNSQFQISFRPGPGVGLGLGLVGTDEDNRPFRVLASRAADPGNPMRSASGAMDVE